MEPRWNVVYARAYDASYEFGPGGDALPKEFGAKVEYPQCAATIELSGRFDGERMKIGNLTVQSSDITPRLIGGLTLASIIREIGAHLLTYGDFGYLGTRSRPPRGQLRSELRLIATLYWREHAMWGNPTQAIAQAWNVPKSTANRWLQQAHRIYPLPGR